MNELVLNLSKLGTPLYFYEKEKIVSNAEKLKSYFKNLNIFYAVKANFNVEILKIFKEQGLGFEVVSKGELILALKTGINPQNIIFNGNGKTYEEVKFAIENGIEIFNFDSLDQLILLEEVAKLMNKNIKALARIKTLVDVETHPHLQTSIFTSKFGLSDEEIDEVLDNIKLLKKVKIVGIHSHIGSNIKDEEPFIKSAYRVLKISKAFDNIEILNFGGGFAVNMNFKELPKLYNELSNKFKVFIEPGRYLIADTGFILAKVVSIKRGYPHDFLVLDCGMSELIRPALYGAYHPIKSIKGQTPERFYIIVGPICESSDIFGEYLLPNMNLNDLVIIENCGAYGYTMSSNYNGREKPLEVLIYNGNYEIINDRKFI
ncbi:MAG: diaminopimelate decarboxylase [candidate division WOR-3 bacterium]|nr:diaminopimelate decarboxylase [candidate division WOR-3 bacterium]MCX7948103.1 diaminopimelate decarboxylase [candidate division WOR-3 bacterium]MDW8150819.1 diaminopimelate decarboxylase [candidate division WOR-3 bacterium]